MSLLIFHSWGLGKLESVDQYQAHNRLGLLENKPQINADERRLIKSDEETCFFKEFNLQSSYFWHDLLVS
jgi:hypothetical protein